MNAKKERLNLNALRVFVAVATRQGFAEAGRSLELPTSNVSRHVSALEQSMGLKLLERRSRGVRLTEAGQALFERFAPLLDGVEDFVDTLRHESAPLQGRMRVSLPSEAGPMLLGPALADFVHQHPELELRCTTTHAGVEGGLEGMDLAVVVGRGALPDTSWVAQPLADLQSVVVAAPSLLARHGMPTQIQELEHLPCITTVDVLGGAPWRFQQGRGRVVQQAVAARVRLDSGALAFMAALRGTGFAILARQACEAALQAGTLVAVPLDRQPAPLRLFAMYPQRKYLSPKVKVLIAHFRAALEAGSGAGAPMPQA